MNSEKKRQRLEACVKIAQEWKLSGMTQVEFAKQKGMSIEAMKYRIRKVRENAPEMLTVSSLAKMEFAAVPQECICQSDRVTEGIAISDQPVLMIQSAAACLQATNQADPSLLKTALEVMLTC